MTEQKEKSERERGRGGGGVGENNHKQIGVVGVKCVEWSI